MVVEDFDGAAAAHVVAVVAAVYPERNERRLLELVAGWNSGEVLDPPPTIELDDAAVDGFVDEMMTEAHVIESPTRAVNDQFTENMESHGLRPTPLSCAR